MIFLSVKHAYSIYTNLKDLGESHFQVLRADVTFRARQGSCVYSVSEIEFWGYQQRSELAVNHL